MAGNKIRGKQIINNEITAVHLLNTGNTAIGGQIPSYDAGSGGFKWISLSADTIQSVSGGTALSVISPSGPNVLLNVNTDNQTIYVNGSNQLHLGDPANSNLITGAQFGFSNNVIIYGNLIVNGTATTVNSETVTIADNFILLNSNFTAGTPTQDAGIEVSRGSEPNVFLRWNEVYDFWEVSNPTTGITPSYAAILTTSSVTSPDSTINIVQGSGVDTDQLYLSVNPFALSNIPNSALTNSTITVVAGTGLGGGGVVPLGGSITLSATPVNDFYVTGGTTSYGITNVGTLTLNRQNGSVNISIEDTFVTGGTLSGTNIILGRNDGQTVTIDLSALDVNDTYVTGGTSTGASNFSNQALIDLTYNQNVPPGTYSLNYEDTFLTGASITNGTLNLTRNDGVIVTTTGTILQSITAQNGLTASTTNGAVTIGIGTGQVTNVMLQNSSISVVDDDVVTASTSVSLGGTLNVGLADNSIKEPKLHVTGGTATNGQYLTYDAGSDGFAWVTLPAASIPSTLNKGMILLSGNTSGNDSNTYLQLGATPPVNSYVGVSVNGVWYEVGNGVVTTDCYFESGLCGGGSPKTFATMVAGDYLCWNGINSGFDLDGNDRIDIYYNA